ncbi:MAG: hypothetical protein L0216_01560 [Planctomycetales bacterium]|nr:hypothetical protein [Planctomycetales bacterium]
MTTAFGEGLRLVTTLAPAIASAESEAALLLATLEGARTAARVATCASCACRRLAEVEERLRAVAEAIGVGA